MSDRTKSFLKNIEAKALPYTVLFLLVAVTFSGLFLVLPPDDKIVSADEGSLTFIGYHDAGDASTGIYSTGGFFFYNSSGAYAITCGGYGGSPTNDVIRTTLDNTGGAVANTSVVLGNLNLAVYTHCTVFDWLNHTFYIMGGANPRTNMVQAFCLDNNTGWDTGANLPSVYDSLSLQGIWYDGTCFAFGGEITGDEESHILAYCPANNTAWLYDTITTATLGTGIGAGYSGTGDTIYLFGGRLGSTSSDKIIAYCFSNKTDWQAGTLSRGGAEIGGVIYNDVNDTFIIGPSYDKGTTTRDTDISEFDPDTGIDACINNNTYGGMPFVIFDNRSSNKTVYIGGGHDGASAHKEINMLDLSLGSSSTFNTDITLKGLTSNRITWAGEVDDTVWCNSSGTGNEWMEINCTINATYDITELRVWVGDLNNTGSTAYINASNITLYASSDNSSYGVPTHNPGNGNGVFTDGGCNITLNTTTWNAGTMGSDPFSISSNSSIYVIFKLSIPSGQSVDTYDSISSTAWTVYAKCEDG